MDQLIKEEIDKILISEKYFDFINTVYTYYNKKLNPNSNSTESLPIQCYLEADQTINNFWSRLLGNKLTDDIRTQLKLPVS